MISKLEEFSLTVLTIEITSTKEYLLCDIYLGLRPVGVAYWLACKVTVIRRTYIPYTRVWLEFVSQSYDHELHSINSILINQELKKIMHFEIIFFELYLMIIFIEGIDVF